MIQLIELLVLVATIFVILRNKDINTIVVFLFTTILLVPTNLRFSLIHGLTIHAVAYTLIISNTLIQRIINRSACPPLQIQFFLMPYLFFIVYALSISYYNSELTTMGVFYSNWVVLLGLLWYIFSNISYINSGILIKVIKLGVIISIYSIVEFLLKRNFLYSGLLDFTNTVHYQTTYRSFGTTNHALTLANTFLMLLPVLHFLYKEGTFKKVTLHTLNILFFITILLSGSRSAVLLSLAYFAIQYIRVKQLLVILTLSLFSFSIIVSSLKTNFLTKNIMYRFNNSESSTQVRLNLLENAQVILSESFWGNGLGISNEVYRNMFNTAEILENPWLAYVLDIGIIGFTLMVISFIVIIKRIKLNADGKFLIIVTLFMFTGYNSISSYSNLVLFLMLLLVAIDRQLFHSESMKNEKSNSSN